MKHNKRRNSALLYEFLIRHISNSLIRDNKKEADQAVALSKKYFSRSTEIGKELGLYKAVLNIDVNSKNMAQRVLEEALKVNENLNARKLDEEKSKLIKEINYTFGNKVYNYKIPNYTIYASLHNYLSDARNKKSFLSNIERVKLEDVLVEHIVNKTEPEPVLKVDPKYNKAVYKFVVERFHKKYNDKLTENQRKFLTKYIVCLISENSEVLKETVSEQVLEIKNKLRSVRDEAVVSDKQLMSKINECYKQLVSTDFEDLNENNIISLMQYINLADEVES